MNMKTVTLDNMNTVTLDNILPLDTQHCTCITISMHYSSCNNIHRLMIHITHYSSCNNIHRLMIHTTHSWKISLDIQTLHQWLTYSYMHLSSGESPHCISVANIQLHALFLWRGPTLYISGQHTATCNVAMVRTDTVYQWPTYSYM